MTALPNASPVRWPKLPLKHGLNNNLVTAHALARSAIFSTRFYRSHAERPLYRERTRLPSTSDIEVFQTAGHQLDQGDADVFYELLRRVFADGHEMCRESHVAFRRAELLRALGRSAGGKTRKLLDESLDRLYRAEFEFSVHGLFPASPGSFSRCIASIKKQRPARTMTFCSMSSWPDCSTVISGQSSGGHSGGSLTATPSRKACTLFSRRGQPLTPCFRRRCCRWRDGRECSKASGPTCCFLLSRLSSS
ncbi:Uncharacterised protein [Burkholderia pseudomallei]|nr:Uncharacterised protein [Burkholderia pseudomallei]CAJ4527189.1 Uncharacterised protein [Burkholderia pseudomallei]